MVMKKCVKVNIAFRGGIEFIQLLQKHGSKLSLEGVLQFLPHEEQLKLVVCGNKDDVDKFVDALHKEGAGKGITDIVVEPHLKDKDYRGVFRIIE